MASPQIPNYQMLGDRPLAAGTFGEVWLAEHRIQKRKAAIKILRTPAGEQDPDFKVFARECQILARLDHENIVRTYDSGQVGGRCYLVMEFLSGGTLENRMRDRLSTAQVVSFLRQIANGLARAHRQGIVHRDLKPANIMLRDAETLVLTDFGIARLHGASTMTPAGSVVGSAPYMSPEQVSAKDLDGRSDLYALGIILYEMLVGETPFTGATPEQIAIQHLVAPLPVLPKPHNVFQPLLNRLLAKTPTERFESAGALLQFLDSATIDDASERDTARSTAGDLTPRNTSRANTSTTTAKIEPDQTRSRSIPPIATSWIGARWRAASFIGLLLAAGFLGIWSVRSQLFGTANAPSPTGQLPQAGFAPDQSTVVFHTNPANIAASFDIVGLGPYSKSMALNHGEYVVEAKAPGFDPLIQKIVVSSNATEFWFDLQKPSAFALTIETEPLDATVRIMNIVEKYRPAIRLPPGRYRINVARLGFQEEEFAVEITDAPVTRTVSLEKAAARLQTLTIDEVADASLVAGYCMFYPRGTSPGSDNSVLAYGYADPEPVISIKLGGQLLKAPMKITHRTRPRSEGKHKGDTIDYESAAGDVTGKLQTIYTAERLCPAAQEICEVYGYSMNVSLKTPAGDISEQLAGTCGL